MMVLVPLAIAVGWSGNRYIAPFSGWSTWAFAYLTWISSINTSWRDLGRAALRPWPVMVALLILHGITPIFARTVGLIWFSGDPATATALILVTAIPIGVSTLVWVGLAGADVPFALTTVALDTMLSPFVIPLTVYLFIGTRVSLDFGPLFVGVLWMIVVPTVVAVTMHDLTGGRRAARLGKFGPVSSRVSMVLAVALSVAGSVSKLPAMDLPYVKIVAALMSVAISGYLLSYLAGTLLHWPRPLALGLIFTAGVRNSVAGGVIAARYFPPQVAVVICMMMFFQQPFAAIAHYLTSRQQTDHTSTAAG
jgi:predicted Na+-dependent transporter